jgi:Flp pilus assembly protein protease CpaA
MVTKIMKWVSTTALLLVVSWRSVASYQIPLDFVVCAGFGMAVLALFFIKREIETHYDVDNRSNPARRVTVKLRA